MSRQSFAALLISGLLLTGWFHTMAADPPLIDIRQEAKKLYGDGNYKEAVSLFQKLTSDPENSGQPLADDLHAAVACLSHLQQQNELDSLLAKTLETHPQDWWVHRKAAELLYRASDYGQIVSGQFERGGRRGGGENAWSFDRDRVQSLRWLTTAMKMEPDARPDEIANFYEFYAQVIMSGREGNQAWKLQDLTDLDELPDYERSYQYGNGRTRGAPVAADGEPVYHKVPESLEAAESDGERWRWALAQTAVQVPSQQESVDFKLAQFSRSQFGVQTLRQWGINLQLADEKDSDQKDGVWSLNTLAENETIAQLATGTKRFKLPADYDFCAIYRRLAESENLYYSEQSLASLAQIFEDRLQYPKAADAWRENIKKHGPGNNNQKQQRLDQIVGNWGQFETTESQPAAAGATVDFRFRNGDAVEFTAQALKVPELIKDVQDYLQTRPEQIDWQKLQIENIGYRIFEKAEQKYLGETVAEWSLELKPRDHHYDRRITVATPLQKAGAYLLTAKMKDGNTTRVIVWLDDTAIVKKSLNQRSMYFVADAVTGKPLSKMKVDFFGWRQERLENTKREYQVTIQQHAEFTNEEGIVLADQKLLDPNYQWIAIAKNNEGRFAHLGFSGIWYPNYERSSYHDRKTYVVTDRPVYRPDQTVEFKFWMRETKYEKVDSTLFANKQFHVKINDPQGTTVFEQDFTTDEYGGLVGKFELPEDATLGQYYLFIDYNHGVGGGIHFRVEEYKKPEFEVTIDTPEKPVELGETVTATIKAKYYYGAPVTNARVQFKVERSQRDARWFPVTRWDWLYGNGYWWFASDYDWYPGFRTWGCFAPIPYWWNWNPDPPELVLDQEVEIGADGIVEVEIDTALAKELHGDSDHEYKITAEVTDASRRTIVGMGNIIVAREPFKVFAWTDRGHYRVGDTINASFQARAVAGSGVQGTGKLKLLKISYEDGQPKEQAVEEWDLDTDEGGHAKQAIKANAAGQYRLSYTVTAEGKEIEGGYLFVIRGEGFDGSDFRFNDLELITNQQTYAPGEEVELMINTDRIGSTVLLFLRPENGVYLAKPQILKLEGKSTTVKVLVAQRDMPNFFIEAITVSDGDIHTAVQNVVVPPEDRVINVEVLANQDEYQPGAKADVKVKLTDETGEPFVGSVVMSVYDRAVEYISGGSNVPEIREFFWKWKRNHYPSTDHNLDKYFGLITKQGEILMANLGVFGDQVVLLEDAEPISLASRQQSPIRRGMRATSGPALEAEMSMADAAMPAPAAAAEGFGGGGAYGAMAKAGAAPQAELVVPTIRENFADTAFWKADLLTDNNGIASVSFDMPENLSAWKLRAWGMGQGTNVGEGTTEVVTKKNLVIRLQAPRFFVEKDEVLLSAVVHNYLKSEKTAQVAIELSGSTLELMNPADRERSVTIAAGSEARIDWRVKAVAEGTANVTMKALTDEESDAMKMEFPVYVHGFLKTESYSGVIRPNESAGKIEFTVPEDRRPEQTRFELRYSPTLAGAMVDALPYLVDYPYGCTEQTLNRFVPTVITQGILQRMNLNLNDIQQKRTNLNAQEIGDDQERAERWKRFDRNPVFDAAEVDRMLKKGVQDLTAMQNSDGGWGWFSGFGEHSYPHTTAVVVHGLQQAQKNDVAIVDGIVEQGVNWLKNYQAEHVALLQEGERHEKDNERKQRYKTSVSDLDALVFSVLVDANIVDAEMQRFLYRDRLKVSLYSQSLIGLALDSIGAIEERDMIIRNIDQFVKVDDENQTAFLDLPNGGYWWFWYGSNIEANAHYLKLLTRVAPNDPKTSGLVKYILNNRKHGTYWTNTRDTAYCIEALSEYLEATDEFAPELTVEVWLDGEQKQTVEITKENLFSYDNSFVIEGADLTAGPHTIELKKSGEGPLYHNAYLTNFSLEDFITKAGLEIKIERSFYKLVQRDDATDVVAGSRGQVVDQKALKYDRVRLESLDDVVSGDLLEIELEIESKNDYEYVIFEDLKAAGNEPVDLQSGYRRGGLGAYVEFRDERVAFFMRTLARGKHSVSYRLRAEIPGRFSALPARAYAMYAPELKANSDEMKLVIEDQQN